MRLAQAEWQDLRNALPRSVFPTLLEMRACQSTLREKNASTVRWQRTPSGFQLNLSGAIKLSILQQLLTYVVGCDDMESALTGEGADSDDMESALTGAGKCSVSTRPEAGLLEEDGRASLLQQR